MRKNKTMRLASCLLAVTLLTTCAISGTFAKYTSSAEGNDTATVAKWKITANGTDITKDAESFEFNLFDTIWEQGTKQADADVAEGKIAPGTRGCFAIEIENLSEVNAKYSVSFTESESDIPLQYRLGDDGEWYDSLEALVEGESLSIKDQDIAMNSDAQTETIWWRWTYLPKTAGTEGRTNVTDTALGIAAQEEAPTVTITTNIDVYQVQ